MVFRFGELLHPEKYPGRFSRSVTIEMCRKIRLGSALVSSSEKIPEYTIPD
jgi:hypothetical protein